MEAPSQYDASYYAHYCGDRPYAREDPHWRRFFGGIADRIVQDFGPRTVLDAGCALGFLVEALQARDVEAYGVDLSEFAVSQVAPEVRERCWVGSITDPIPERFPQRYDLIVSIEVLEHLPPEQAGQAVKNLCGHTDDLLFSSSPDDHAEVTHLCVKPPEAWAELFAREGFLRDLDADVGFVTPWAIRFRRSGARLPRVVREYERQLWWRIQESLALREKNLQLRAELDALRERATAHDQAARDTHDVVGEVRRSYETTRSWQLTRPLRWAAERVRRLELGHRSYAAWVAAYDPPLSDDLRARVEARIASLASPPTVSVVMPVCDPDPAWLREAIDSVRAQLYPHWELCLADDGSTDPAVRALLDHVVANEPRARVVFRETRGHISAASNSALELARGELVTFLDHDDTLAPHALFCVAEEFLADPKLQLVYSDEDKLAADTAQRHTPHFKPELNLDLLRSLNYVCHLAAYRTSLVRDVGGLREGLEGAQDHDLVLRCLERIEPAQVRRIPLVLYHWRAVAGSTAGDANAKPYAIQAAQRAVADHLERSGVAAEVRPSHLQPGTLRVEYGLPPSPPLVSVVVPTRDRVSLLRTCLSSLRSRTEYPRYEVLVVDNGSSDPEARAYLAELEGSGWARVLRRPGPFNFAALNNDAVREARGELVLLLNNDTEVVRPGWLSELVRQALRPEVGAVGARLWYPDGTLQHGGVITGAGGVAGHAHLGLRRSEPGYMGRARVVQDLSAVTAACLCLRKEVFEEVGGFDAEHLAVAFGDVDLCLEIRARGYLVVWTPYAELVHHESASRGRDQGDRFQAEAEHMRRKWGARLEEDPAYSPSFSLERGDFALAFPPRVRLASRYLGEPAGFPAPSRSGVLRRLLGRYGLS